MTTRTCRRPKSGFQSFLRTLTQTSPALETFGWKILVENWAVGGLAGKSEGKERRRRKEPLSWGVPDFFFFFFSEKRERERRVVREKVFPLLRSLLFWIQSPNYQKLTWTVVDGLDVADIGLVDDDLFCFFLEEKRKKRLRERELVVGDRRRRRKTGTTVEEEFLSLFTIFETARFSFPPRTTHPNSVLGLLHEIAELFGDALEAFEGESLCFFWKHLGFCLR